MAGIWGSTPRVNSLEVAPPKGQNGESGGSEKDLGVDPSWVVEKSYPGHSQALKKHFRGAASIATPTAIATSVRSTVAATSPAAASAAAAAALHGPIGRLVLAVAAETAEAVTVVASP